MKIKMTKSIYYQIKTTIGTYPAETGGMLGSMFQDEISHYVFDKHARTGLAEYNPDVVFLNNVLNQWANHSIDLIGMIHSHPAYLMSPSYADLEYAKRIIDIFDLDYLFLPIIKSQASGAFEIHAYIIKLDDHGNPYEETVDLYVDNTRYTIPFDETKLEQQKSSQKNLTEEEIMQRFANLDVLKVKEKREKIDQKRNKKPVKTVYQKLEDALDLSRLEKSLIIGIGCGGARDFYIDMARSGVGHFILMDKDCVEEKNIGVQGAYYSEIGQLKVEVIKAKLKDIHPSIEVTTIPQFLDDSLDDAWFEALISSYKTENILLCAFTDDFYAQARSANLALKYKLKYLSAQHYHHGIGSEVIYYYPAISKTTPRCYLNSRYEDYLSKHYQNQVTSQGSLISNTTRLNALCGKIALGMLNYHQNNQDMMISSFLEDRPDRNLIIIRHNHYLPFEIGMEALFSTSDIYYHDDCIWLSIKDINASDCEIKPINDSRIIE